MLQKSVTALDLQADRIPVQLSTDLLAGSHADLSLISRQYAI